MRIAADPTYWSDPAISGKDSAIRSDKDPPGWHCSGHARQGQCKSFDHCCELWCKQIAEDVVEVLRGAWWIISTASSTTPHLLVSSLIATSLPSPVPAPSVPTTTVCNKPSVPSLLHSNAPLSLAAVSTCPIPEWRQRLSPPPNIHTIDYYRKMGWLRNCRSLEDRCTELEARYPNWQSAKATWRSGGATPKSGGAEFAHWYRPPPIYRPFHSFRPTNSLMRRNVRLHSIHPHTLL